MNHETKFPGENESIKTQFWLKELPREHKTFVCNKARITEKKLGLEINTFLCKLFRMLREEKKNL